MARIAVVQSRHRRSDGAAGGKRRYKAETIRLLSGEASYVAGAVLPVAGAP